MQLVAYGAQDIYLTGNPLITYFKVVYRRHTNFAMESIPQVCNGSANFGQTVTTLISRNGDLITGISIEAELPGLGAAYRWTDNVGHYLIKCAKIEIGGQTIDTHYSDWLEIWSQLTVPAGQKLGYLHMIGQDEKDSLGQPTGLQLANTNNALNGRTVFVPLQFWFCRNVGLALPLIALQYHEVKLQLQLATLANLSMDQDGVLNTDLTALPNLTVWVDYIYLDTDERRRFAQVSHEYLIEQLQTDEKVIENTGAVNFNLNLNHPVKELIWVCRSDESSDVNQWNNYTTTKADTSVQPIVYIIPEMRLELTAADTSIWARNNLNNAGGAFYEALGGTPSHYSTDPVGDHTHSYGVAQTTGTAGSHSHTYSLPALKTNGSPIEAVKLTVDYGNLHKPILDAKNSYNGLVAAGDRDIDVTSLPVTLASVTSDHDFTTGGQLRSEATNPVVSAKLTLNGQDRFATRSGEYFNQMTTSVHTNKPASRGINVYSFAIKPEEHQPSGTCNFSRIDNATLMLTIRGITSGVIKVFATNYNVLRIMSGMGGLAYSN